MNYKISRIAETIHASLPSPADPDHEISILLTDSRSLTYPDQSIFFAIRTRNNDGHRYMRDLYDRGVRHFVARHIPDDMASATDAAILLVPSVTRALQDLARAHRSRFDIPVVGITGSRGKTTVKEWLYQLLSSDYSIVRSPRSYNSQIGVPLSIWELDTDTTMAIFEAGISLPDEMTALQGIIKPNIGIITNIGPEHADGFTSLRTKCDEKVILMRDCDVIIYNGDDRVISEAVSEACIPAKEIAWSTRDSDRPLFISAIRRHRETTDIDFSYLRTDGSVTIPFTSDADIQNAIHCLALMLYLNRPADITASRISQLAPVATRMEVKEGVNDCLVIYDAYTSDLNSMQPALDFLNRRRTGRRSVTAIISDVMHETLEPQRLYREVARLLTQRGVDRVIGVGEEISANSRYFPADSRFFPSTSVMLSEMSADDFDRELVLVKGASRFHFEMIAEMLEARQHETVLEVNLDALVSNFNLYRSMLRPTTGIICMVKASGYGAGSYELAKTLQAQGAAYMAVAVLDEGVELREAGITMPVMVMNPHVANYKTMFAYRLEPEVYSFGILREIIREGEKCGITDFPVHIKLDTGMHRLGFIPEEIPELIDLLRRQKVVRPHSLFSHLATADCPHLNSYTEGQLKLFDSMCAQIQSAFSHYIMRHILNSAGIVRYPSHQYDMVRLGIGLYGVATLPGGEPAGLRTVSSLRTVIISIREWPAGTTIGYGCRGVCTRRSRIATIPVGYADGIDRHLGNGGMRVWINGHRCPSIGNICMDACMIDVTDADCQVGDRVEIFGDNVPVEDLSDVLDTIPYEMLTSVSTRVKRIYYRE
ncbi:bifunctional UDP-N-acetylmuramoyl-tripeptide:D-alanyl-D-alanine ligase/alanine racemase [Paramuribaculum intestinale]|uniref:bifunctional UDP-N-acetylmuramoyl-tripeptide:D-alanyl-D-alanine ligase/alanine racemase n=1 Tax=Paramuribaculum intestinale TaxID=2094151 RepID=UPI0025A9687C|nr:bifunctional UDP-N-acetylmuramoyl-tripeptide:D-alanyl-D-alanine ligase/alanine racemase [Paramuribaculum intestinale]